MSVKSLTAGKSSGRSGMFQPVHYFQAGARGVIRAFPFAHLRQFRVRLAVRVDAPEPFPVDAVHEVLLNKIPDAARGGGIFFVAGNLEGIEKSNRRLGLRPAFFSG